MPPTNLNPPLTGLSPTPLKLYVVARHVAAGAAWVGGVQAGGLLGDAPLADGEAQAWGSYAAAP